jgi:hypothetical protein
MEEFEQKISKIDSSFLHKRLDYVFFLGKNRFVKEGWRGYIKAISGGPKQTFWKNLKFPSVLPPSRGH